MKRLLLLVLLTAHMSYGQHATCDGTRYAYPSYTAEETLGVMYGNATTFAGNNQDLFLDFFEPQGDVATARPLIILAFGGSFINGTRQDMHWMCEYYTSLGYATASIDYRLYDGPLFPFPDSVDMTEEVLMAVSDMKAAIRYFKQDAANGNSYRIDSNYIFVGGISSGGITASHTALLDSNNAVEPFISTILQANGGWTGNSSINTQHSDNVRGLLNYSGALRKASYIDAGDPPFISFHDDNDDVVPYGFGWASVFGQPIITLEGSLLMDAQAQNVGVTSQLVTTPNSTGHVSYFGTNNGTDSVLEMSTQFLFDIVCPQFAEVQPIQPTANIEIYPNPAVQKANVVLEKSGDYEINIMDQTGKTVRIYRESSSMDNSEIMLDLNGIAAGSYLITVKGKAIEATNHLVIQ